METKTLYALSCSCDNTDCPGLIGNRYIETSKQGHQVMHPQMLVFPDLESAEVWCDAKNMDRSLIVPIDYEKKSPVYPYEK